MLLDACYHPAAYTCAVPVGLPPVGWWGLGTTSRGTHPLGWDRRKLVAPSHAVTENPIAAQGISATTTPAVSGLRWSHPVSDPGDALGFLLGCVP